MPIIQHFPFPGAASAIPTANSFSAWSLRKVNSSYSGSAIRVRRSSDSTELDIGFSGTSLDTASLLSFVGAGDGFIRKWYDQFGNSNEIGQATAGNQPKIVSGGVLNTNSNGTPRIVFTSTSFLVTPIDYSYISGFSLCMVGQVTTNEGSGWNTVFTKTNFSAVPKPVAIVGANFQTGNSAASTTVAMTNGVVVASGFSQWSFLADSTAVNTYYNGAANGSTGSNNYGTGGLNENIYVGRWYNGGGTFVGNLSEMLVWQSVLSTTDRQTVEASQKAYHGTP